MWLKCLLGSIYELEWLKHNETPERPEAELFQVWAAAGRFRDGTIFHQHFDYSAALCEAVAAVPAHLVTIVRDPYDTFVSTYFTLQQHVESGRRTGARTAILMGKPLSHPDVLEFLATGGYRPNLQKASEWLHSGKAIALRYEELRRDPLGALTRAANQIRAVDPERIKRAIARCSAENMRERGGGLAKHVRTATIGDSANHLNDAHLAIFREHYADLIRELGYEVR
jgi:hypothetical protein